MTTVLLLVGGFSHADDGAPVTLQLRWHHQFQFAGYYAALQQGYYRDAGLDVSIVPGSPNFRPVDEVLGGRAQFGVANNELLYHRLQGEPLVALAAIFQHSGSVYLAKQSSGIRTPQDFVGRRVMMSNPRANVDLIAMLRREGLNPDNVKLIDSSYNINDLINDRTDVFNSYLTNETYLLAELDIPYTVITPTNYGIDFYSDVLFTTEQQIEQNPETVRAFRSASLRGWTYAMQHPEEIIQFIKEEYGSRKSVKHLRYEAQSMRELIVPELINIGHMNPGRWQHMASILSSEGLVEPGYSLDGFIYETDQKPDISVWLRTVMVLITVILFISVTSVTLYHLNRKQQRLITRREQAEKELSRQKSLFEAIFYSAPDAMVLCDTDRTIRMCNPAFNRVFGYQADEVLGHSTKMLYQHSEDFEQQGLLRYNPSGPDAPLPYEINYRRKTGEIFPSETQGCRVKGEDGEILGFLAVMQDITLRKQAEEEITLLAMTDSLTGLANRYHFEQSLEETLSLAKRRQQQVSLALMDLDYFKQVNDQYGHAVGDSVLMYAASVLRKTFRQSDLIARIGGDEFAVLMYAPESPEYAEVPAERVISKLSLPVTIDSIPVSVGASFGIATYPGDTDESDELFKCADIALYESKRLGRNRCSIYRKKTPTQQNETTDEQA